MPSSSDRLLVPNKQSSLKQLSRLLFRSWIALSGKMTFKLVVVLVLECWLSAFFFASHAEMIFRGKCSRIFQPEETTITVDLANVVFNRYLIRPIVVAKSSTDCTAKCLSASNPPCRSAFYEPYNKTCILLRASKDAALEFDAPDGAGMKPMRGTLLSPQSLVSLAADRTNGIVSCSTVCPAPSSQTEDTMNPVCVQDCPNSPVYCAGEEAGCFDYPRSVSSAVFWNRRDIGWPGDFATFNFVKLHDFTSIRLTFQTSYYYSGPLGWGREIIFITAKFSSGGNWYTCGGESGLDHSIGKDLRNVLHGSVYPGEPMGGEMLCTRFDVPKGSYSLTWTLQRSEIIYATVAMSVDVWGAQSPTFVYAEEYVPARSSPQIDDSARCQTATVFNVVSQQPTYSYWNSYGGTPHKLLHYKKRSDSTVLRLYWGGKIFMEVFSKCIRLYFTINDRLCTNPYSIEHSVFQEVMYNGPACRHDQAYKHVALDGICRGLPAGRYDIQLWVASDCPDFPNANYFYNFDVGSGWPSQMFAEEIRENLLYTGMLLSDGTLAPLPYYNRQYYSWNDKCSHGGWCGWSCGGPCYSSDIKTFTYQKSSSGSNLHVKWYGGQYWCIKIIYPSWREIYRWYITFNGVDCSTPFRIESWWLDWMTFHGLCYGVPKYVEGVCKMPITKGPVTIGLRMAVASPYYYPTQMHASGAGLGGPSYLMVEEIAP